MKEQKDEYINGVKIERLPTFGEAESVKTIKQGRRVAMRHYRKDNAMNQDGYTLKGTKKRSPYNSQKQTKILCKRILKFNKTSSKQRAVVEKALASFESVEMFNHMELKIIAGINKFLCLRHKEY